MPNKAGGLKSPFGRGIAIAALTVLSLWLSPCVRAQTQTSAQAPATNSAPTSRAEKVVLPRSVPDPLEPLNRVSWAFNEGLMSVVIKPTSWVYRRVVPKRVRTGVGNIGRNLTYPQLVINNLLQGKWTGARDESYRFLCNTTVGVAGFFDVGTKWNIPKSDADFGQTFGQWGWDPQVYIMMPVFGPSNERDTVGFAADTAVNPLLYISPYAFDLDNPLTWLGPYSYFTYAVLYNNMSDSVGEFVRFSKAESDPYSEIQYAWTFARKNRVADFQVKGEKDEVSLETLESVFFTYKDPEFPDRGKNRSVTIPATGRKLAFTFWLQPGKAPVVYIVPGLGSHRLAQSSLALGELAYTNGFSAVCISSPFNSEFMEHASTAALPAYLPADGQDLLAALTEVDHRINALYPDRMGEKALMGYSMGALELLYIAANGTTNAQPAVSGKKKQLPLMHFDRFVAINTPVRMAQGLAKLDEFYDAPLEWPAAERTDNIENTFLKVAALSKTKLMPQTSLPFSAIESKFLIGLMFRLTLRDIIYSSQRRNNQGVLQHSIRNWRRDPVYQEILQYSYHDYYEKFVIPYYQKRDIAPPVAETLEKAGDLRTYEAGLKTNANVRIIVNQNDFLLTDEDLAWLRATFPAEHLKVFEQGGHLGNLVNPAVQKSIVDALGGLKPVRDKPE